MGDYPFVIAAVNCMLTVGVGAIAYWAMWTQRKAVREAKVERRQREMIEEAIAKAGIRIKAEMDERSLTLTVILPRPVSPRDAMATALVTALLDAKEDSDEYAALKVLGARIAREDIDREIDVMRSAQRHVVFWEAQK